MFPRTLSASQQIATGTQNIPQHSPISHSSNTMTSQDINSKNKEMQRVDLVLGNHAVNTHFFDGKLPFFISSLIDNKVAREIENDILRAALVSKQEKTQCFHRLEEKVREYSLSKKGNIPSHSLKYLREIVSTHDRFGRVTSHGNYDSANKLHACDLLYLLYEKIMVEEEPEYMRLMLEQLDEMSTGSCSQGRTTRLFQALVMLRTDLTPTSK